MKEGEDREVRIISVLLVYFLFLFHNIVVTTIGIWLLCFMTFDLIVFSWIKTMIKASSTKNVLKSENADDYVVKDSLKFYYDNILIK